jgi:DNA-directed RNA polymerase subunit RPC12/RpoP
MGKKADKKEVWDFKCSKCGWQGLDGETLFDGTSSSCPKCSSNELTPNTDNSWDYKCTSCGWRGLLDEAKYDENEEVDACPKCSDTELSMNPNKR